MLPPYSRMHSTKFLAGVSFSCCTHANSQDFPRRLSKLCSILNQLNSRPTKTLRRPSGKCWAAQNSRPTYGTAHVIECGSQCQLHRRVMAGVETEQVRF